MKSTDLNAEWSVNLSETDSRTMSALEVVESFKRGEMAEAYVWREGMDDWKPLLEVSELATLIQEATQVRTAMVSAKPASAPRATGSVDKGAKKPASVAPKAEPKVDKKSEPKTTTKSTAARVAARGVTADLFGSLDKAGSEEEPNVDIDQAAAQKLTGARNENSVLFSLDALKAGASGPAASNGLKNSSRPAPKAPTRGTIPSPKIQTAEDVLNMGGGGTLFTLGANQALVSAPPPPEAPKPKPAPVVETRPAAVLPVKGAPLSVPPAAVQAKSKKILFAGLGGAALVVIGGLALIIGSAGGKSKPKIDPETTAAATTESKPAVPPATQTAKPAPQASSDTGAAATASAVTTAPAESAKPEETSKPAESAKVAEVAKTVTEEDKKRYKEAQEEAKKRDSEKKDTEKKKDTPAPAGATGAFDKGAAVSALTSAASAASACKRPGGPTGAGRVTVTFAPSGRATTANVTGGAYGGTPVGGCVANVFRRARVPAFGGSPVTVAKSFNISP